MLLNPLRLLRRRRRLKREALDEAHHLRRRHGPEAVRAAREKLNRPELTSWGREIMEEAIRLLRRKL